jgi:hypothetical protein
LVYLDTSALVAFVSNEPTAAALKRWVAGLGDDTLCSSDWCVPEVASALSLKVRTGQLQEVQADGAWTAFGAACDGLLELMPLQAADCSLAAQMCRVHKSGLRAGAALHLAVAMRCKCHGMLSLDHNLNLNARANGLALISP